METKRVTRLLALIRALQSCGPATADDLAVQVGVSKRTVFRDLEVLRTSGLFFDFDRESKRYSTKASSLLPPVTFTQAEALALVMGLRFAADHPFVANREVQWAAAMKVECALPPVLREYCGPMTAHVSFTPARGSDASSVEGVLAILQGAIAKTIGVEVEYDSYYDGRVVTHALEPYGLTFIHRAWYVIARVPALGAVRTFKLERVRRIRFTEDSYVIDPGFSLTNYFGNAWLMIRGDREYHVRIRFLKKVAANVDEVRWHRTQRTKFLDDGSLIFEADVDGVQEIAWWVLGYGDQAEVLAPLELREIVAEHARRMAAYYEGGG